MSTYTLGVHGPKAVAEVVTALVEESVSFDVMPLPDNDWDITVKVEAARLLRNIIAEGEHR